MSAAAELTAVSSTLSELTRRVTRILSELSPADEERYAVDLAEVEERSGGQSPAEISSPRRRRASSSSAAQLSSPVRVSWKSPPLPGRPSPAAAPPTGRSQPGCTPCTGAGGRYIRDGHAGSCAG